MSLTAENVAAMAPDPASLKNGQKLAAIKNWKTLGRSETAVWGLCQGSATYQVRAELVGFKNKCSCPSRKFPCKHVLGLLLIAAGQPTALADGDPPDWVTEWLAKQAEAAEKKAAKVEAAATKPVDEKAKAKRIEKREGLVAEGLDRLNTWLADVVRTGLGRFESVADEQAREMSKRLVDCQAKGLAGEVEALGTLPVTGPDWPARFLASAGRLRLLTDAYARQEDLPEDLQADVRQAIGWTVDEADLEARGETVQDRWAVLGQWVSADDRIETQRTWLVGAETGRTARVLQFRPVLRYGGPSPGFAEPIPVGVTFAGRLTFYPGRSRQRARIAARDEVAAPIGGRIAGHATCEDLLAAWAETLARWPFATGLGVALHDATLVTDDGAAWQLRDGTGLALPITGKDHWRLLAITGGHAADVFGEWDGRAVRLLGLIHDGRYVAA